MEYETVSQYRTQGKMILLINEWIGVLWGFRQQQRQLWSVMTGTSSASQRRTPSLKPRVVFIMKPIAQMNISNFPRVKQQWWDWNKIWRQGCPFWGLLFSQPPVLSCGPLKSTEPVTVGTGWVGKEYQAYRLSDSLQMMEIWWSEVSEERIQWFCWFWKWNFSA